MVDKFCPKKLRTKIHNVRHGYKLPKKYVEDFAMCLTMCNNDVQIFILTMLITGTREFTLV